jgi:hypothetical protein
MHHKNENLKLQQYYRALPYAMIFDPFMIGYVGGFLSNITLHKIRNNPEILSSNKYTLGII